MNLFDEKIRMKTNVSMGTATRNIVKYVVFFSILFFLLMISPQSQAQNPSVTYTALNVPLSKVFTEISEKYNVKFAFDAEVFKEILTSFSVKNESFKKLIRLLADKHALEFRFLEGTYIVIRQNSSSPVPVIPKEEVPVISVPKKALIGFVSDQVTGEPLMYCGIVFPNNKGTITNELGYFYLETTADSVRFSITHLGYQRLDTIVVARTDAPIRIRLIPFVTMFAEVNVIRQEKNTIEMSKYAEKVGFNSSQSATMPRLANDDLVNMLTMIPGVSFLCGPTGGLSIRGSNPSENLIILDGIPLLETGHLFGNVSALNAGFIRQAFVSRGGFDTQFGDRVSGLIELTGRTGSRSSPTFETSANLLNGDMMASIPITKKFSITGALRRSYIDYWKNYLFKKLLGETRLTDVSNQEVNVLPTVRYQDINLKASFHPSENNEITLSLIRSDDQQMLDYEVGTNPLNYRNEWVRETNTGYGLNWSFQTGKWHHQFTSGYSELHHKQEQESGEQWTITTPVNPWKGFKIFGMDKKIKVVNPYRSKYELDTDSNNVKEFRALLKSEVKSGIFTHQFGAGFVNNYFDFHLKYENSNKFIPVDSLRRSADQKISHLFYQQFIEPSGMFKIRWGLRINYDQYTGKLYWQPRGGVEYAPLPGMKVYYFTGKYDQFLSKIPLIDYNRNVELVWYLPDASGKGLLKSFHHVAGFQWEKSGFLVNAEFYNKHTTGLQWLYAELYWKKFQRRIQYISHAGEERNRGFDLFVQYRHSLWNHQAGYSFSDDVERIDGINKNTYFPSLNNHRHQLQLAEIFSVKGWVASANWIFRTGQPKILPTTKASILEFDRFDYFSQLDMSLAKNFRFRHFSLTSGLSLLNILNRLNIVQVDYVNITSETNSYNIKSNVSSLSFTPVFFLKFQLF
jgi:ferric enterobactin receptor